MLRETDGAGAGAALAEYVYGSGGELVSQQRGTSVSFHLADSQGSTRKLTNLVGAATDTYDYDAFGNLTGRTGTTINSYLFTGQQQDANTGFYYLRARYYNPTVGRFITTDPSAGTIFDPPSLHQYTYANNDPVNKSDPTGKETLINIFISSAVAGILAGIAVGVLWYVFVPGATVEQAITVGLAVAVIVTAMFMTRGGWAPVLKLLPSGAVVATAAAPAVPLITKLIEKWKTIQDATQRRDMLRTLISLIRARGEKGIEALCKLWVVIGGKAWVLGQAASGAVRVDGKVLPAAFVAELRPAVLSALRGTVWPC